MQILKKNYKKKKYIKYAMLRNIEEFYLHKLGMKLKKNLHTLILDISIRHKTFFIKVTYNNLNAILFYFQLHSLASFKQIQEITCIDNLNNSLRFNIIYTLYSIKYNTNLFIVVQNSIGHSLPSISPLYKGANWLEREVFDLFGVFFNNHSDLRRILTDYGFKGYPLQKDFPLTGFFEIYYNDSIKKLTFETVELTQETRIWWSDNNIQNRVYETNIKIKP